MLKKVDCLGLTPESWACIDCGVNTHIIVHHPGIVDTKRFSFPAP
jgi:hypothetical protein